MKTFVKSGEREKFWNGVLAELQLQVSKPVYGMCFGKTTLVSFKDNVVTIGCPNPMVIQMVESRYYSLVKSVVDHRAQTNASLVFTVSQQKSEEKMTGPLFESTPNTSIQQSAARAIKRTRLSTDYTFETFAVSSTNQMAYAAATAVSKDPGEAYNPLLFYGGVGVGKTHLMQAIGHAVLSKNPSTNVVFCMGDEFTNEIIEGIRLKTTRQFKQKYRKAQLLLVDDIQFIAGKQTVQEEFFHTFNAIRREGGQIILTSDRPPSEISRLEERLRSRFEAGLIIDIGNPDFELRSAIANIKGGILGVSLSPETAQLIAANITTAREIKGFLQRLKSEHETKNLPITSELVSDLLGKKPVETEMVKNISPQQVLSTVCKYYNLKKSQVKGEKRSRPIARPRQIIMYILKTDLGATLSDVGNLLGGRDHTTIMHGVETITKQLSTNEQMRVDIERIKNQMWG